MEAPETVTDFLFLGSRITVDGDCGHEIKRPLFLERKAMTNLDSMLKTRDIILPPTPAQESFFFVRCLVFLFREVINIDRSKICASLSGIRSKV